VPIGYRLSRSGGGGLSRTKLADADLGDAGHCQGRAHYSAPPRLSDGTPPDQVWVGGATRARRIDHEPAALPAAEGGHKYGSNEQATDDSIDIIDKTV
jgi:hypothetical protein